MVFAFIVEYIHFINAISGCVPWVIVRLYCTNTYSRRCNTQCISRRYIVGQYNINRNVSWVSDMLSLLISVAVVITISSLFLSDK